ATWASETTSEPSSSDFASGHISSSTLLPPIPSTKLGVWSMPLAWPARSEAASGAAVSTSQAKTFTCGLSAPAAHPRPAPRPPAEGDEHRVHIGQVPQDLEPDRPVAGDHGGVAHRMDEETVQPGVAVLDEDLPPRVERHLDRMPAQAGDRLQLGFGCGFRDDD